MSTQLLPEQQDPWSPVTAIGDAEFAWIAAFLEREAGIRLRAGKQTLVTARLERRLRHHDLGGYGDYIRLLASDPAEAAMAVDLLTTNETYFFREPQHFEDLVRLARPAAPGRPVRVWSAACSTGEEASTIALVLADALGDSPWEIVGTDVSDRVLDTARRGLYPLEAADRIPDRLRRAHCRRGRGDLAGLFALDPDVRSRISYRRANLTRPLPDLGRFDVVFLRNVLIYFSPETKRDVVDRVAATLRPGGHLVVGHAESLTGLGIDLVPAGPCLYRRDAS